MCLRTFWDTGSPRHGFTPGDGRVSGARRARAPSPAHPLNPGLPVSPGKLGTGVKPSACRRWRPGTQPVCDPPPSSSPKGWKEAGAARAGTSWGWGGFQGDAVGRARALTPCPGHAPSAARGPRAGGQWTGSQVPSPRAAHPGRDRLAVRVQHLCQQVSPSLPCPGPAGLMGTQGATPRTVNSAQSPRQPGRQWGRAQAVLSSVLCRMDNGEACFILSSRNEVDRTAAVSVRAPPGAHAAAPRR